MGVVNDTYVTEICAAKFHGLGIQELRASQLQDLVFTLTQRLRKNAPISGYEQLRQRSPPLRETPAADSVASLPWTRL